MSIKNNNKLVESVRKSVRSCSEPELYGRYND